VNSVFPARRFQGVEYIEGNITASLNKVSFVTFGNWIVQVLEICKNCVAVKGEYFVETQNTFLYVSCVCVLLDGVELFVTLHDDREAGFSVVQNVD
jgi:hypothetical protein